MNLARVSQLAEWAVAGAVVLLHAAIFLWPERADQPNYLVSAAHDAQLFASIVLILSWAVLGPGRTWVRGAALPLLLVLWFLPWNTRMIPRETAASFAIEVAAATGLVVVALRLCKVRVAKLPPLARERGAQFSILALLIVTTLIAATVGLLEWLRPMLRSIDNTSAEYLYYGYFLPATSDGKAPQTMRQLVLSVAVAGAGIGGLWVMLRPGAVWLRLAALVVCLGVLAVYLPHLSGVGDETFREEVVNLSVALAAIAALVSVSVLPLRLMDFRLQRPVKAAESANPQTARESPGHASRLRQRVAALLGLMLVVGATIPAVNRLHTRHAKTMQSPAQAFARFVEPRRHEWTIIRGSGLQYRVYLINWEARPAPVIVEEPKFPPPAEGTGQP
jgi:hypothetical protein